MPDPFGLASIDAVFDEMVDLRRTVHQRPELSFQEHATTELIRNHMTGLGIDEPTRLTDTGGVFAMDGGRPGRTVVLRADIDALPVHEDDSIERRSEVDGVMHACGHDVHVAALLGVAQALSTRREDLSGRYVFVFQPAEESLGGAKLMVEQGALELMTGASLIGFHVSSLMPTGLIGLRSSIAMSEAHAIRMVIEGPGGHGAMPTGKGDVVRAAAELVSLLGGVVEGLEYEGTNCVCSAGMLQAGTAVNVVPTRALVAGTLRTFTDAQRVEAIERLGQACAELGDHHGVTVDLQFPERTRAVVNDPDCCDLVEAAARQVVGANQVMRLPPLSASDDVSEFLAHLPGCYFFVGGADPGTPGGMHHSPTFAVLDESLRTGASVMLQGALALAAS
ncbi:MAG TPA: M20 family metallopeptidase [Acidimicrobiales bacterium]|jgi:amidohydrolase